LTTLRCIQGLGIGGEWGGALLLAVEHAGRDQRGLFGSVPQMAIPVGMLLGTVALSLVGLLPEAMLLAWGWRIPFLFSAVLVLFGFWMRRSVDETPVFRQAQAEGAVARLPVVETLRRHPTAVLQAVGLKVAETASFYVFSTFAITYATHYAGFGRATALNALALAAFLATASIPLMGMLADRWGARRLFIAGTVALMLFAFPYFWLISLGSALWLNVATTVAMAVCWAPITAVLGTLYAGMFSTEVRYTGVSLGYQLGAALAGGTAPLVATFLLERFAHSWLPVAAYLVAAGALSLVTIATIAGPHE
jgi:MFS family permease